MLHRHKETKLKKSITMLALSAAGIFMGVVALNALGIVGLHGTAAIKTADAIMAGMDIAAALSIFGGVTAIAGLALIMLKQALKKASKKAILA